jgi:hypothetical protein
VIGERILGLPGIARRPRRSGAMNFKHRGPDAAAELGPRRARRAVQDRPRAR